MVGINQEGLEPVFELDLHGGIGRRFVATPKVRVTLASDKPSILQPKDPPVVADAKAAKADKGGKPNGDAKPTTPEPKPWRVFVWAKPEGLVVKLIDGPLEPLPEAAQYASFDVTQMPTLYVRNNGSWAHFAVARIAEIDADKGTVVLVLDSGVEAVDVPVRKRTATGASPNGSATTGATGNKAKK